MDITPIAGYPLGGHSIGARIGRGHWVRLYARALYLEGTNGQRVVLVANDLWSIPAGLVDRVAELVASGPPHCRVGREGIVLAATHTHQSPGNFSTSLLYNTLASPEHGFDRGLFEFLAGRIASAVIDACRESLPADAKYVVNRLGGLARNRSLPAFLLNPEAAGYMERNRDIPPGTVTREYPFPEATRAVDVSLRLLTLTARAGARSKERTIALAAFVSVHPTSLGNVTEVYSGDFFGVAALEVEHRLSERGQPPPVVAIFNGPEGDVSPQWHAQDRRDTLRLGRLLGEALARVSGHGERVDGPILRRGVQLSLSGRCARDDDGRERCAAVKPAAGLTTLGGAEDGRPQPYYLGCVEGLTRADGGSNDGHGVKLTEVDGRCRIPFWLPIPSSRLVTAILPPPSQIPLLVFRFGSLVFATLPGEFTTMLGERIRSALRKSGPAARDHVLIGLANEYLSYFTTPEEYDLQHYEGSSMLYGREAGAVVAAELGALAASVDSEASKGSPGRSYRYAVGGAREFGVLASRSAYDRPLAEALRNLLLDLETGLPLAPPRYCWTESPEHVTVHGAVPGAMIEVRAGSDFKPLMINGRTEDDSGTGFVIAVDRIDGNGVSYCALWLAPRGFSAAEVRFRIRDARGRARCSEPFAVSQGRRLEGASREIEDERPGNECRA